MRSKWCETAEKVGMADAEWLAAWTTDLLIDGLT